MSGGDLIKIDSGEVVSYLNNASGMANLAKPFERDVLLFDTYIAGVNNVEKVRNGTIAFERGERLILLREPHNRCDKNAITIKKEGGERVGYIPRQDNIVFSRLMDAGKELFGKVSGVETRDELLKVRIQIFMVD